MSGPAAMIFAAGKGTRLGELGKAKAKCLMEAGSKTMLEFVIERLKGCGIKHFVINLHHLGEQIRSFVAEKKNFGVDIRFSPEAELLDTGGGLKKALPELHGYDPIIVHNGDIYCEADLGAALKQHQRTKPVATLLTLPPTDPRGLLFDENGRLLGWENTETKTRKIVVESDAAGSLKLRGFAGIQIVSKEFLPYLENLGEKFSIIDSYLVAAKQREKILSYDLGSSFWIDIGTPEKLEALQKRLDSK